MRRFPSLGSVKYLGLLKQTNFFLQPSVHLFYPRTFDGVAKYFSGDQLALYAAMTASMLLGSVASPPWIGQSFNHLTPVC